MCEHCAPEFFAGYRLGQLTTSTTLAWPCQHWLLNRSCTGMLATLIIVLIIREAHRMPGHYVKTTFFGIISTS